MADTESIQQLQERLTHLEKHISEQDSEIYKLSKRVDSLLHTLQKQKLQLEALAGGGAGSGGEMPADEKPPHY